MKLFAIYITNNATTYGGAQPLRQAVLFVFVPFDKNTLGDIIAIRYRGYYYDTETGFYYLQTRYYDPTICRFINADNYELVIGG